MLQEVYPSLRGGTGKSTFIHWTKIRILISPVIDSLIHCESSALDHAATEADGTILLNGVTKIVPARLQMEYSSLVPHYSAHSSVSSTSDSCGGRPSRLRTLRLVRRLVGAAPPPGRPSSFGFSLRGGREHGTGFFVSAVETGSEAHCQGLRVGDQIIRVNGFPLEDAIHKEVLQLIQNQNQLSLKVRTVGMIPVKDKRNDPLTWRVIEEETVLPACKTMLPTMESTAVCSVNGGDDGVTDVRLFLNVPPRAKLGCGICKGPDWKPGIFVQFTKENGIAREAGLRPGDQIIHCNGVNFKDITFGDAVHVMKSSHQLDLIVRKRAGLDLFPGESSGYNSSASSVNGDQSPSWEDTKRLSVVKEESMELEERLGQLETNQRKGGIDKNKDWDQIEYEWEKAEQKSGKTRTGTSHKSHKQSGTSCTIISVENDSGHFNGDTQDSNSYTNPNINQENVTVNGTRSQQGQDSAKCSGTKLAEICMISQQQETTTVIVEVHRSEVEDEQENDRSMHTASEASPVMQRPSTAANKERKLTNLVKSPSSSSFASVASSSASSSLSSAISQELQRRSQRQEDDNFREEERKKDILKTIDDEKRQQHEQLMEEFKKAHRKMFAHAIVAQNCNNKSQPKLEQLGREQWVRNGVNLAA
uniref:(California timema) hypothetical protein n=1 Tax=Timema californicum TaxID=61474 RepID=A0A7R9P5C1_TIMCA|nr:unnamed protein product [Timema californicum]